MNLTATCCCERSGITVEGTPVISAVCHCDNCKKRTGSAFGVSVYFKNNQVISTFGNTESYKINKEAEQERHFCKTCGSTIYWNTSSFPEHTGVAGGCFGVGLIPEPVYTLSNKNKCTWLELSSDLKHEL